MLNYISSETNKTFCVSVYNIVHIDCQCMSKLKVLFLFSLFLPYLNKREKQKQNPVV